MVVKRQMDSCVSMRLTRYELVVDGVGIVDRRPRGFVDRGDRHPDLRVHPGGHRKPGSGPLRGDDERVTEVRRVRPRVNLPARLGGAGAADGLGEQAPAPRVRRGGAEAGSRAPRPACSVLGPWSTRTPQLARRNRGPDRWWGYRPARSARGGASISTNAISSASSSKPGSRVVRRTATASSG